MPVQTIFVLPPTRLTTAYSSLISVSPNSFHLIQVFFFFLGGGRVGKHESDANRSNMAAESVCHEVPSALVSKDFGGETGRVGSFLLGQCEDY